MRVTLVVAMLAVGGCFHPEGANGQLSCSTAGSCPSGYDCLADHCWLSGSGPDLAVDTSTDMSTGDDLAVPPVSTTTHALDTETVPTGTLVSLTDVVIVAPTVAIRAIPSTLRCQYLAFVQDPAQPPPNGLGIFVAVPNCAPVDGGSCTCPTTTGTLLDQLATVGDRFTLVGLYNTFGTNPVSHQLSALTSATKTGSGVVVAPVPLTDVSGFAPTGSAFVTYENMLVSLQPAGGITISAPDGQGNFSGAGVVFTGLYRAAYASGGSFPMGSTTFTTVAGVVDPNNGGSIAPRLRSDFSP